MDIVIWYQISLDLLRFISNLICSEYSIVEILQTQGKEHPFTRSLSPVMPSSSIQVANKAVKRVLDESSSSEASLHSRGQYITFLPTEKTSIAKYTREVGMNQLYRLTSGVGTLQ